MRRRPGRLPAALSAIGILLLMPPLPSQTRSPALPESAVANLPVQRIGANDLLAVSVYDAADLTRTVRVAPDGFLRLPMLKRRIRAEGLMPADLEPAIAAALSNEQLMVDPLVTVTVAEYASRPISVAGAVKQPLTFQAVGPVTLLQALTRAGGLSSDAGPEILVGHTHASGVQHVPVKVLIEGADPAWNLTLTGGDEVRVPEAGKIYVIGNVRKPGAFPLGGAMESSVLKMLALSEGLMPYASKQAYIHRRLAGGEDSEIMVPLGKIMERKAPDAPLLANDILYIPDNKGRRLTLGALEKILIFGSGASAAAIYGTVR